MAGYSKVSLALFGVMACSLIVTPCIQAQTTLQDYPSPHNAAQNTPQKFLTPHNVARNLVGVGPLVWDNTVAAYAQNYANLSKADCKLQHSGGPYGENIFWGSGREFNAEDAVKDWVGEKQWYDYDSNSCAGEKMCGHYTQVVWKNTFKLGCATVTCDNGETFITCNYNPQGNYIGERPY